MKMLLAICMTTLTLFNSAAFAAGACTSNKLGTTQSKLRKTIKSGLTWKNLRAAFDGNRECMKTYETYDFGEAPRTLYLKKWESLGDLARLKKEDPDFYKFALDAVADETAVGNDLSQIDEKALRSCPKGLDGICKDIHTTLTAPYQQYSVLNELDSPEKATLYALDPFADDPKGFEGYKITKKMDLTISQISTVTEIYKKTTDPNPAALLCGFVPHHGPSVTKHGKTTNFVSCYKCHQMFVFQSGKEKISFLITGASTPLDKILGID